MDISNANTEAYAVYNRFHNNLNLTSKVAAAGILTLKRLVNVDNGDVIMGTLVDTVGLPWGTNKPFPNPTNIADNVYENLINNTFVQAFAGFEHYLTNLIADIAHFSEKGRIEIFVHAHTDSDYNPNKPPEYSKCCLAYAEQFAKNNVLYVRVSELCDKLEISKNEINKLLPLFDYFRNIRNCIVHLNGTANKDLIESWEDSTLKDSIGYWNSISRKDAPALFEPTRGKKVELNLTNSIMASALCFKIAQLINNQIPEILGTKGYIHMAAYNSLLVDFHEYRDERKSNTPEGVVSNYLTNRYFVKDYSTPEFVDVLKSMNLWKHCRKRFEMLN
jgi:hypothetical protein